MYIQDGSNVNMYSCTIESNAAGDVSISIKGDGSYNYIITIHPLNLTLSPFLSHPIIIHHL